MQALAIRITDSDTRYFKVDPAYKIGIYLERDRPAPDNQSAILCVGRVPSGTQAPVGRLTDQQLQALANQQLTEVVPEVIARFPYWSYIEGDGAAIDVPDDTRFEDVQVLPPSLRDATGAYVLPPNGFAPAAETKPAAKADAAEKADAVKPDQPAKAEKAG